MYNSVLKVKSAQQSKDNKGRIVNNKTNQTLYIHV